MKWYKRDTPRSKCKYCDEVILWMKSRKYNPFKEIPPDKNLPPLKFIAVNFNWDHEQDTVIKPEHVRHSTTCKRKA